MLLDVVDPAFSRREGGWADVELSRQPCGAGLFVLGAAEGHRFHELRAWSQLWLQGFFTLQDQHLHAVCIMRSQPNRRALQHWLVERSVVVPFLPFLEASLVASCCLPCKVREELCGTEMLFGLLGSSCALHIFACQHLSGTESPAVLEWRALWHNLAYFVCAGCWGFLYAWQIHGRGGACAG